MFLVSLGLPQIIMLGIFGFDIVRDYKSNGNTVSENINCVSKIFLFIATIFLLKFGGFFVDLGFPQIIVLGLLLLDTILAVILNGKTINRKISFVSTLCLTLIMFTMLFVGGFF